MSPALAILASAVVAVESGGNASAVGARGEVGALQIRPVVVRDLNRIAGRQRFTLEDRRNYSRSIEMFRAYLGHYATPERIGREPSLEDMARIWNGGPHGWRKPSTKAYWLKVRAEMESHGRRN